MTADSCVLQVEGRPDTSALALASLKKLEVVRGQKSHWLEGAALGTMVGMVFDYIVSYPAALLGTECAAEIRDCCVATTGSLIGGGLRFLIGADLGPRHKRDRWEPVPLDRLRVGSMPERWRARGLVIDHLLIERGDHGAVRNPGVVPPRHTA